MVEAAKNLNFTKRKIFPHFSPIKLLTDIQTDIIKYKTASLLKKYNGNPTREREEKIARERERAISGREGSKNKGKYTKDWKGNEIK